MEYIYHYLGGVAELIAVILADSSIVYVHSDHLATPRLATNADGVIVWRWISEAFGEGLPNEDVDGDGSLVTINHRFPGQYLDRESELSYNYFRDYDAGTGRYVQSDPIGLAGGINTFGYVGGNTLMWIDFLGLTATCPAAPPVGTPGWGPYKGPTGVFHCGYDGYLEDRTATPDDPAAQCFYDENQCLVDENHEYKACAGTNNQYTADDWWNHTWNDSGGIREHGAPALSESIRHEVDSAVDTVNEAIDSAMDTVDGFL